MKFIFDPNGNPYEPAVGWIRMPDGTHHSGFEPGWTYMGYTVGEYQVPDPVDPEPTLDDWRRHTSVSSFQAHTALVNWGIHGQAKLVAETAGHPIDMAFERASVWRRTSPAILSLFSQVILPATDEPPTEEELDQFFRDAQNIIV